MKKAYSFRLSDEAILAIRVRQKELGLKSEAAAVEAIVLGVSSNGRTTDFDSAGVGSIPAAPATLKPSDGLVMPKGSMKLDDLKQLLKSGGRIGGSSHLAPGLLDSAGNPNLPCAPFDINLEGEPHRVVRMGSKLALQYIGGGEPVFTRHLQPGELEKFWEARIRG